MFRPAIVMRRKILSNNDLRRRVEFEERSSVPHVVLSGRFYIREWSQAFSAIHEQIDAWIIKVDEIYVEHGGDRAILPAIVIEEGHPQTFYMRLSSTDSNQRLLIRLDPATDPIKTKGVKRAIALVAERLREQDTSLSIETHNLKGFFKQDNPPPLVMS